MIDVKIIEDAIEFLPKDLVCIKCNKKIIIDFDELKNKKEKAVTCCPYCNYSYID